MKNGDFIFDTNIVIYLLRDKTINMKANKFFVSVVTELELFSYQYLTIDDENKLRKLINYRNIIEIDSRIKEHTIQIRKTYRTKLPDSIICATAITKNLILVTEDMNLKKIHGLNIISYNEIKL